MTTLPSLILAVAMQQSGAAPAIAPEGPLSRTDGVRHQFTMTVQVNYAPATETTAPFVIDLIAEGPWSTLQSEGLSAKISAGRDTRKLDAASLCSPPSDLGATTLSIPIPPVQSWPLTVSISGTVQSYSSRFNDAAAMQIGWPETWPTSVRPLLSASELIDPRADIITDAVEQLTKGQVRSVPPVQAAKLIVQDACRRFELTDPRMLAESSRMRGILVQGAAAAARAGQGTPADLVCICVAMLRAAGLPARPVIGMGSAGFGRRDEFGVWAEVYLPACGWCPFDPEVISNQSVSSLDATRRWEGFGTMPALQRRIPLSWSFAPDEGQTAFDAWALWGWTRFLPSASFPIEINGRQIATPDGPWSLTPQRPVPSTVRLERS